MALSDYYDIIAVFERQTPTPNGFGGVSLVWATNNTVEGLLDLMSGQERAIAAQNGEDSTHIFMCDAGEDIKDTDRMKIGTDLYRIVNVDTPFGKHMEVTVQKLKVDNQ